MKNEDTKEYLDASAIHDLPGSVHPAVELLDELKTWKMLYLLKPLHRDDEPRGAFFP